jgi:ribonucleoside-triphosphate reductase
MNKFEALGIKAEEDKINALAEERVLKEIEDGMQLIQYQLITLQTTNGQAPFVTVFMYINEIPEGQVRDDLVTMIKIMLDQRIKGVKDESGNYITPAFPKLIYVLQENNISEGSRYYDVTKLAAKCTAKRMVPDYISAKKMREYKNGDVYPCMGCRSFLTPDRFSLRKKADDGH